VNRDLFSIVNMCRVLDVTRNGFNSWFRRGESLRSQEDEKLHLLIKKVFERHKGHYGSPKITKTLRDEGVAVGQKRVARIMREQGLSATKTKLYPPKKKNNGSIHASPNLIHDLDVNRPNQLWVGDITYIKLESGEWLYLSAIMDRFTRQLISWSVGPKRDAALTCGTLSRAVRNRNYPDGVIYHSDKGSEYIANSFRNKLAYYGIKQSMNRKQKMNDNAFMESFFNSMKIESIKLQPITSEKTLRRIASQYIRYYNRKRIHMSIGGITPNDCELQYN
jgi:putative transposase|tara:strand:+ start:608 stop:1441 length:834 start_codon:yes stop_codon:yes gene_type:complete